MTKTIKKHIEWCVEGGRPSWHQQRAGHAYESSMCFREKRKAVAFMKRVAKLRPDEPQHLVKRKVEEHKVDDWGIRLPR
jgi:hypothetical protein